TMKKNSILLLTILCFQSIYSQTPYSPAWFGPNANPVPEFTDATIPAKTTLSLMGDYYLGHGDHTENGYFKVEFPLLPERVSLKIWSTILEHYQVTDQLSAARDMQDGNTSGTANGDFYVQTRMLILKENKTTPAIILNSTLKTASGTNQQYRRYFNTAGYYFDAEIGKSIYTKNSFISEIRGVVNFGFMCWDIDKPSTQDDAPMYGGKIIIGNENWKLENTLSGYWGWMHTNIHYRSDYGDAPMVYTAKIIKPTRNINYFAQYETGIHDFPYQQLRVGVSFPIEILTPKYK
ncbi:MAG: hypothetical protein Q8904_05625, partial [Bacteroidota bacterium]|nr:hypothetical protein [Bacteroidota bacterium]